MSIPSGKPAHDTNPLDRLDEIQARTDKATEGPWRSRKVDDFHDEMPDAIEVLGPGPSTVTMVSTRDWDSEDDPEMVANAEFIAHARTDVPNLVGALQAVLDLCDSTTLECRPGDGSQPYMVVPADAVKAAIEVALEEAQS